VESLRDEGELARVPRQVVDRQCKVQAQICACGQMADGSVRWGRERELRVVHRSQMRCKKRKLYYYIRRLNSWQ
jgi:hypothetical protein